MTRALLLAVIAAVAAGCTDSGSSSSLANALSAPSSATQVADHFSGTVAVGGSDSHTFTVTASNSPISATLTAAGPPATIVMGLGVGQMVDGSCSVFSNARQTVAAGGAPVAGTISAGSYCVAVFDVGNQSAPVDYAVTVVHY